MGTTRAAILSTLRDVAAEWLRVEPSEIDTGVTFQEMGAGSIMLVDTIRVIDQTFGLRIKAQRFF
jgi:acyl carrier protein